MALKASIYSRSGTSVSREPASPRATQLRLKRMEILTGETGRNPSAVGRCDGSDRPRYLAPKVDSWCRCGSFTTRADHNNPQLTRCNKKEYIECCASLRLRQHDVTSHSKQKHGTAKIVPSRLSRSGASDGSRDLGSPSGPTFC
jgi:hypothetical protein